MPQTLADIIRQQKQQLGATGPGGNTQQVQQVLGAKTTGKALGGASSAPATSTVGEQVAQQQGQEALTQQAGQVAMQEQGQQQQAANQATQVAEQKAGLAQKRQLGDLEARVKMGSILGDLRRERAQLGVAKDKVKIEQASQYLAMQDKKYLANLDRGAREMQLDNEQRFEEALTKDIFGANADLLKSKLGTDSLLKANDRQFEKQLAGMKWLDAAKIAREEMRSAMRKQKWQAASTMTSGIIGGVTGGGGGTPLSATKTPGTSGNEGEGGGYMGGMA